MVAMVCRPEFTVLSVLVFSIRVFKNDRLNVDVPRAETFPLGERRIVESPLVIMGMNDLG